MPQRSAHPTNHQVHLLMIDVSVKGVLNLTGGGGMLPKHCTRDAI